MGLIFYHPDGYMSAQLMRRDRLPFVSGDWLAGTPANYLAEAGSYFAYYSRRIERAVLDLDVRAPGLSGPAAVGVRLVSVDRRSVAGWSRRR